jgi:hypothetical protein
MRISPLSTLCCHLSGATSPLKRQIRAGGGKKSALDYPCLEKPASGLAHGAVDAPLRYLEQGRVPSCTTSSWICLSATHEQLGDRCHRIDDRDLIPLTIVSIDLQTSTTTSPRFIFAASNTSRVFIARKSIPQRPVPHSGNPSPDNMAER